ncbi:hypothetical protein E3U23_07070 [Erythrobacter litoralis]|uniref:hypothetical protein n=1 Tax=Erythrobacter litoralis TaxID=39960 RepID=UPI00243519F5|nr:hypothetical protein [Erythrobacter litoralis]MDG6078951.1 hypothetical protein [Erythrobacter litoralis]
MVVGAILCPPWLFFDIALIDMVGSLAHFAGQRSRTSYALLGEVTIWRINSIAYAFAKAASPRWLRLPGERSLQISLPPLLLEGSSAGVRAYHRSSSCETALLGDANLLRDTATALQRADLAWMKDDLAQTLFWETVADRFLADLDMYGYFTC